MDKLEKHIKEKLEERTIAPSEGAWDKIASQVKGPSPKRRTPWLLYAVAASVVGVVLVSVFFFTNESPRVEENQVVETATKPETTIEPEQNTNVEPLEESMEVVGIEVDSKIAEIEEPLNLEQPFSNDRIAEEETKTPLKDEILINSDALIAQKVEEVVAQVELMEHAHQDVTDAEVDSLLRAAQRQILTDKLFTESGSVDAMALLAEVEDELDETFRDQIFDALKSGYLKLRTAVADRNQ
ncbi:MULTISPECIES: hypothetical protein [unclassified Flagellimonas]|uniref:Anti sigma-E protein RseA N-terminal domain-containing protein n=1 Tax=Flagellimonas sp. MMG031 TaxID=3158549 RepID=A0AAU7N253_9FLAO